MLVKEFDDKAEDQLFRECLNFFSTEWNENEDAPTFLARIKNQHRDFRAGLTNKKVETVDQLLELLFVSKTLHVLPSRFESFKSGYLLLHANEDKKLDNLAASLITHERNVVPVLSKPSSSTSGEAFYTRPNTKHSAKWNEQKDSNDDASANVRKKSSDHILCKYCNGKGHWLKKYSKWIADGRPPYPARASGSSKNPQPTANVSVAEKKVVLVAECEQIYTVTSTDDYWWVDNGATKHITPNRDWFCTYELLPSNYTVKAAGNVPYF